MGVRTKRCQSLGKSFLKLKLNADKRDVKGDALSALTTYTYTIPYKYKCILHPATEVIFC